MAWSLRASLSNWKPTAKWVVACLIKCAGGVAAAADPANEQLYKCFTAGSEQAAEHFFDTLPDKQQHAVEKRFAQLQTFLNQHTDLIRLLETVAEQQTDQNQAVEALTELLHARLPAELQLDLQRCLGELGTVHTKLGTVHTKLHKMHRSVLRRLKKLEKTVARTGSPSATTVVQEIRTTDLDPTPCRLPLPPRDDQGPTLFLQPPECSPNQELPTRDDLGPVLFPCVLLTCTNEILST